VRDYEITLIVQPDMEDEDRMALIEQAQSWITALDGEIAKVDHWGMRRLAYPIRRFREGYYVHLKAQMRGENVRELERRLQLSESVIRYLTVRVDDQVAQEPQND